MSDFEGSGYFNNTAVKINIALLCTHVVLLLLFLFLGVKPMFYFNIGSVAFYAFCFFIIYKKLVSVYINLIVTEIVLHMFAATICCGWGSGFQYYSFGIVAAIYYTYYTYNRYRGAKKLPVVSNVFAIAAFIAQRVLCQFIKPYTELSPTVLMIMEIANGLVIFGYIIVALHDFTIHAVTREQDLEKLADNDELTQLFNRHKMNEILQIFEEEAETGSRNFCISMLDIDDFKQINDTFGHEKGDEVLVQLSKIMKKVSYEEDTWACRWGGEEFLIAQQFNPEDIDGIKKCENALNKVHEKIMRTSFTERGRKFDVTVTAGFAAHMKGQSIEDVIRMADERLYCGKNCGKNVVITEN